MWIFRKRRDRGMFYIAKGGSFDWVAYSSYKASPSLPLNNKYATSLFAFSTLTPSPPLLLPF